MPVRTPVSMNANQPAKQPFNVFPCYLCQPANMKPQVLQRAVAMLGLQRHAIGSSCSCSSGCSTMVAALCFRAHLSTQAPPGDQHTTPGDSGVQTAASSSGKAVEQVSSDPWTEVVHEATGQIYYWNQQTGQTTALGEAHPGRRRAGGGGQQQQQQAGNEGSQQGGAYADGAAGAAAIDPRAESPLEDKTGQYAATGIILGVFFGWAAQFF